MDKAAPRTVPAPHQNYHHPMPTAATLIPLSAQAPTQPSAATGFNNRIPSGHNPNNSMPQIPANAQYAKQAPPAGHNGLPGAHVASSHGANRSYQQYDQSANASNGFAGYDPSMNRVQPQNSDTQISSAQQRQYRVPQGPPITSQPQDNDPRRYNHTPPATAADVQTARVRQNPGYPPNTRPVVPSPLAQMPQPYMNAPSHLRPQTPPQPHIPYPQAPQIYPNMQNHNMQNHGQAPHGPAPPQQRLRQHSSSQSLPHTVHSSASAQSLNSVATAPAGSSPVARNSEPDKDGHMKMPTPGTGFYTGTPASPGVNGVNGSPGTAGTAPSSLGLEGAKPMPRRQYGFVSNNEFGSSVKSATKELDVETFETARRHAISQPHNPEIQLDLAKRLCEAANVLASRYSDPSNVSTKRVDPRQEARNKEAWILQAQKITKRLAAKSNYPEAIFYLGSSYSLGNLGLEVDEQKALECYQRAAKMDHSEASYRIAVCYEFGVGIKRDSEKAMIWYKKAAHLGSVSSMYKLGMIALHGTSPGQPRNFAEGLIWLQRAAEKADAQSPHAVHELALLYERSSAGSYREGDNLPKNEARALELYYKAAKLGYSPSKSRLGRAYEFGELGCEVDAQRSISWYSSGAQQGDADAELGMCGWYWTGAGHEQRILRQSDTEAFLWAERAAQKGHSRALFAVGHFCEHGVGVPKDIRRAREFYVKAAEKRHPRSIERLKELDRRMPMRFRH